MSEYTLFRDLGIATLGATVLGFFSIYIRIPLILMYLIAGIILGPHLGLGIISDTRSISTISQLGLVMLMFILGLEIELKKIFSSGKLILIAGFSQIAISFLVSFLFFYYLEYSVNEVIYLSVALALSSTVVVIKILTEKMQMNTIQSRLTVGILVIQDLFAVGFLAIQKNLNAPTFYPFLEAFLKGAALLGGCAFIARFLLPRIFKKVSVNPEMLLLTSIAWLFLGVGMAEQLGVSREMGALIAGVVIASFPYHFEISSKLSSLRDFFITLFFVALGLRIRPLTPDVFKLIIFLVSLIYFTRSISVFPVMHWFNFGNRSALLTSINLSQFSEFGIVIAALGVRFGHVSQDMLTAFIATFVLTALFSNFFIPFGHMFYQAFNPILEKLGIQDKIRVPEDKKGEHRKSSPKDSKEEIPEVVILGFFREGSSFLYEMLERDPQWVKKKWLVVDLNPDAHRKLHDLGVKAVYGDISHFQTLAQLPIQEAKLMICTISDNSLKGATNLKILQFLKKHSPQSKVIVQSETIEQAKEMYSEGADYVVLPRLSSAKTLLDVYDQFESGRLHELKSSEINLLKLRKEIIP